jgi:hypothetical protein
MAININKYDKTTIDYIVLSGDIDTFEKRIGDLPMSLNDHKTEHFYMGILHGGCYSGLFMNLVRIVSGCREGIIDILCSEGHNLIFDYIMSFIKARNNGEMTRVEKIMQDYAVAKSLFAKQVALEKMMAYINSNPPTEFFSKDMINFIKSASLTAALNDSVLTVNKILNAMGVTDQTLGKWFEIYDVDCMARKGCINVVKMICDRHPTMSEFDRLYVLGCFATAKK